MISRRIQMADRVRRRIHSRAPVAALTIACALALSSCREEHQAPGGSGVDLAAATEVWLERVNALAIGSDH
jgi:hypothetical protein